jgi:hypothetical protein
MGRHLLQRAVPLLGPPGAWPRHPPSAIPLTALVQLLNSTGVLLATQAILVLQPTHTPSQKRRGTAIHGLLNGTATAALLAAFAIIAYNKAAHEHPHFESPHAVLGLITYILLCLQAAVGFTQYYTPSLYGGPAQARAVWKHHRRAGYVVLGMLLATVCAAAETDTGKGFLGLRTWGLVVASALVLVGVIPRIKLYKLGFKK